MGTLQINTLGTSFEIQAKEDDAYLKNLLSSRIVKKIKFVVK